MSPRHSFAKIRLFIEFQDYWSWPKQSDASSLLQKARAVRHHYCIRDLGLARHRLDLFVANIFEQVVVKRSVLRTQRLVTKGLKGLMAVACL